MCYNGEKGEKEELTMNPRVFISSTFYDLKYAREGLGRFISGFGFEPIQSERSNIGYIPGEALDKSCYVATHDSGMAVLIVGGEYGSPASSEAAEKESFDSFISITHKEFNTAVKNSIPVFVFIEGKVYDEYNIYKANKNCWKVLRGNLNSTPQRT